MSSRASTAPGSSTAPGKTLTAITTSPSERERCDWSNRAVHRDGGVQRRLDGQRDLDGKLDKRGNVSRDREFYRYGFGNRRRFNHHHRFAERHRRDGDADRSRSDEDGDVHRRLSTQRKRCGGRDRAVHGDGDIQRRLDGQRDLDGELDSRKRSRRDDQFGWTGHCDSRGFDHDHRFGERRHGMATLTVPAATKTLSSIAISPPNASVAAGATEQFTAMATYSDGSTANVTSMASWTAANAAVATINSAGLATAIAAGSTTITASVSGVSGMATLTVPAATKTLTSIAVSPAQRKRCGGRDAAVHCDGDIQRRLDGQRDLDGKLDSRERSRRDNQFGWTGHCDRRGFDHHHRFAERRQRDGDADRSRSAKTVTSLAVSQLSASFAVGATEQFTATATYSDGSTANVTATVDWTVANESVATIDPAGLATGVAAGSTTVSASLDGVSGDTSLIVTIAPGTGVNIATWHADNNRSGLNPGEQSLSPSNVSPQTFGKLFSYLGGWLCVWRAPARVKPHHQRQHS